MFASVLLLCLSGPANATLVHPYGNAAFSGQEDTLPEYLPAPQVSQASGFSLGTQERVLWGQVSAGLPYGVFGSAVMNCEITRDEIGATLSEVLLEGKKTERAVNQIASAGLTSLEELRRRNVAILITSFGNSRSIHSSFFLHRMRVLNRPVIVLDCAEDSRKYWGPSLAHEMAHALMVSRDLPSWMEESIAQMVETEAGGKRPELALRKFYEKAALRPSVLPKLWDEARPIRGFESYSINYLFGRYLLQNYGGWETLRAMISEITPECRSSVNRFEEMLCMGRNALVSRGTDPQQVDRFTPAGLLRFFAVAFVMNSPKQRLYSISGWSGLTEAVAHEPETGAMLEPGQFWIAPVVQSDPSGERFHSELEVYRLQFSVKGFKITPRGEKVAVEEGWGQDLLLVIHTGTDPVQILR